MMKQYPVHTIQSATNETIAYRQCGSKGPVILLVHGNMSSSVHWQVAMEQLEDSYQVYALDLPGFGDSTYNRQLESLHDFSRDVTSFVEKLDLQKVHVLGWSTGGGIVLESAADIPERYEKIFLLDSVGIKGYPMYKKDESFQPILTERIYTREEIAKDPIQVAPILNAYATGNKDFMRAVWNAAIYNLKQPSEEDYEIYLDAIFKQRNLVDVDVALTTFNMSHEHNGVVEGTGRIDLVQSPIVVMHGISDLVVPLSDSTYLGDLLKDQAELVVFENVGHSVLTDNLKLFIDTLIQRI